MGLLKDRKKAIRFITSSTGYSIEYLEMLSANSNTDNRHASYPYWVSEVYSHGVHFRNYAFYPAFLPLYIYSDHGIGNYDVYEHEIANDAEAMFVFDKRKIIAFQKYSNKPCYNVLAPFVWYRRSCKIKPISTAKGTLAFPAHTTPHINIVFPIEKYIAELKSMPEECKPVSICLHMHDINRGWHKIFMESGFPVYTAGNAYDKRYAERFYEILKHFKYTTSNLLGSYAYYSVEMGIPFFLYGEHAVYYNDSDPNIPLGVHDVSSDSLYKEGVALFKDTKKYITTEQLAYVEKALGIQEHISRMHMAWILYTSYIKWPIRKIFTRLQRSWKKRFSC